MSDDELFDIQVWPWFFNCIQLLINHGRVTFPAFFIMSSTYNINCEGPVSDNLFALPDFVEYLHKHMKCQKLRNNLQGKVEIQANDANKQVVVTTSVKYSKRSIRYYARKFLQKQGLHQRFRVIATAKDTYEMRQYGPTSKE